MQIDLSRLLGKDIKIVPAKMTLKFLGTMDLNKEKPISIIMKYAAIAQKEYAIKCTLDAIDDDIDNCFLIFVEY